MSNNHVICQAEVVPVQTVITEAYIEEAVSLLPIEYIEIY